MANMGSLADPDSPIGGNPLLPSSPLLSPTQWLFRNVKRGGLGSSAEGTRMEAPKASRGVGSGEGAVPPLQKNFGIFSFEMVHFDAFWSTF